MTLTPYLVGEQVRFFVTFADANREPFDPPAVMLTIEHPDGSYATITNEDNAMEHDGVGQFAVRRVLHLAGDWRWRWESMGEIDAATRGLLVVSA